MIAGLTGGIGSGKTVVARLFGMLGCAVFNSDEAAKAAYFLPGIKEQVTSLLGVGSYLSDTQIDKKYISDKIFGHRKLLEGLNSIIHPAVGKMFQEFVARNPRKVIIKESALLFEAGVTGGLDKIIVVVSPDEERISRVMKRDKLSREEVLGKIQNQLPQEEKARRADFVVQNDEKHLLIGQTERIFTILCQHDQERPSRKTV